MLSCSGVLMPKRTDTIVLSVWTDSMSIYMHIYMYTLIKYVNTNVHTYGTYIYTAYTITHTVMILITYICIMKVRSRCLD